jgi:hypothetical protein
MDQREGKLPHCSHTPRRAHTQVFSGEKTEFSEDFADFEAEIEPLKLGVER